MWKFFVIFVFVQVLLVICECRTLTKLSKDESTFAAKGNILDSSARKTSSRSASDPLDAEYMRFGNVIRKRRSLSSVVTLLWPQVVGPIEEGHIQEPGFDEVPKTIIEHHLDIIRKNTKLHEETRYRIREYLHNLPADPRRLIMP